MNPHIDIALRSLLAFTAILILTRLVGKQQVGQLTVSDFVNAIVIGSIGANMATDHKENVIYYIIGIVIIAGLTMVTNYTALKSRAARKIIEGEPVVVIHNGKIMEKNIKTERYSIDNLLMQLREKNVFNISDVEFAIAEPNGELSVLLKSDKQPLTPRDINLSTQYQGLLTEMIMDGQVIYQNLEQNNLSLDWLLSELKKKGIDSPKEVAFAGLDTSGNLYVDKYRDQLKRELGHVQDITDKEK
ncbi:YetF domain-containing protein [Desulfofalx alkaliphila]|uniref:YetF domain-containing protein n=1 Tax=Desulfofalx alkaliphila TaxID=105483 RepID=UPI0004E1F487|nr:DUF421 domain-containing protein [Desulfofalx alkaliphila]